MNALLQDIRFAIRSFAKNPWFTLAAVCSLAIGIGANTSIFSVANALMFRPLPYHNPDRLVILWNRSPGLGITQDWFSTAQYFDIKTGHHGFEQVAIAIGGNYNLTGQSEPERVGVIRVSSNLFQMLGARPALGRLLTEHEDSPGQPSTAVLTDGMWARRFGRDPHMIGKSLIINGQTYEVVGILPHTFSLPQEVLPLLDGTEQADIFLALPLTPAAASQVRDHEDYNIVCRLRGSLLWARPSPGLVASNGVVLTNPVNSAKATLKPYAGPSRSHATTTTTGSSFLRIDVCSRWEASEIAVNRPFTTR